MFKGRYIVVEGLESSGKSTQAVRLVQYLGPGTLHVREPGGTAVGEKLREIMKDKLIIKSSRTNMFLFMACRANLVDLSIRPTITAGNTVVSDRNWLSSLAYQQVEGANIDQIISLSKLAMDEFLEPDLLILIDTAPETCLKRMNRRQSIQTSLLKKDQFDYFGKGALRTFRKLRENYLREVVRFKNHVVIDGNDPADQVWAQIQLAVEEHFN